jgi:protein N-terminal amidase
MRLATLQFDSLLGQVESNIKKADSLLCQDRDRLNNLDILILPELAFTGYNHKSYADIEPYLEPTSAGSSTQWAKTVAQLLGCVVAVGYPEQDTAATKPRAFNSLVFVDRTGNVVAHTRKKFLYYIDETWASEGPAFFAGDLQLGSSTENTRVSAGICMDLNPYKFEAPWNSYEFANHSLRSASDLVILSMAWSTPMSSTELHEKAHRPDLATVAYWLKRMIPLVGPGGANKEVVIVFANRCGEDGEAPLVRPVRYAGSSSVLRVSPGQDGVDGNVRIWEMLGRAEEGVLVVDTKDAPMYTMEEDGPGS